MAHCCDTPGLMPIELAMKKIWQTILPLTEQETVSLTQLVGRVLAQDICALIDVPGYDNSAMDGYALRAEDVAQFGTLRQIGKSFAGTPFLGTVTPGQCVRIMTGACIPTGADAVVMQENTEAKNDAISVLFPVKVGEAIRRRGEDIRMGEKVLAKGHKISPADIGLLASVGVSQANVFRAPKVAIFSTGDELRQPHETLPEGCIYDSNRYALQALLTQAGMQVLDLGVIADNPNKIRNAFLHGDENADVVITSGGVSVGEADFTREILEELGQIDFWKLAIKPGKPLAFGRLPNSYFFGLPGNPVSSMVTFHQIALPALFWLSGKASPIQRLRLKAKALAPFKKRPGRTDFQRGTYTQDPQGNLTVKPLTNQGSGVLSSITKGNCYVVLENELNQVKEGEYVTIEVFDEYFRAN
ncbi:molybdopterin molybdotransferase MoeA [Alteromonas sp. 14N.309.X.WAT.G.H12]|uniref:molybdopterin molybdotransferase MoeA n=1 Tax=Alteromonas sp. 14N.309.X.WAT.G.H12 TaxID=3120824 RepID=UPI002FD2D695